MSLERFDLGGEEQWALVQGTGPVLLLIQAGPGFPIIHDAAAIERQLHLEEHFRVVYWDQRGTGKSFDPKHQEPLPVAKLVADVRAMIHALCQRLGVSQLDVVGFSLGASLALLACAENPPPVRSLTCVGPDVNLLDSERCAYDFALAEAERRGHKRALRALRKIGAPPHADVKRFMERVKWVSNFGGVHRGKSYGAMLRANLAHFWSSPHYSLGEMVHALRGISVTQERMLPGLQGFDLLASPLRIAVPAIIFQGRHDQAAPPRLGVALAEQIGAPLVWFENSAHMPHEEEPARFREQLLGFVRGVSER